jgi:integrase
MRRHAVDRATVRQRKTGQPVRFEMTEQTQEAIDNDIRAANKKPGKFLFGGRRGRDLPITTRQYARLVGQWIAAIGLDPGFFGTHSFRRTKATLIYRRTGLRHHLIVHGCFPLLVDSPIYIELVDSISCVLI